MPAETPAPFTSQRETLALGMAPASLSAWLRAAGFGRSGLLLDIATAPKKIAYKYLRPFLQDHRALQVPSASALLTRY